MEQGLPIEELANQRLNVLVHAYTLLIKNLMEEGVEVDKVKKASDKVWAIMGQQSAEQMKPMFAETKNIEALQQTGQIAASVHGIEMNETSDEKQIQSEIIKCPWQEANLSFDMPDDWRMCPSGHQAFTENLFKGLVPSATFELTQNMPAGDQICLTRTSI